MKKLLFFSFLLLFQFSLIAQKTIKGRVLDNADRPLEGAAVYLNNTSVGTTTNEKGEFELDIRKGSYELIASYLGYQTAQFPFDSEKINKPIVFKLIPKANMLDEVVVSNKKNTMSEEDRAYFLGRFKSTFLGRTNMSLQCKILNEDVIDFDYDMFSNTLEASVSEPIQIEHKGLGYRIYIDLVHFELTPKKVTYLGYNRYENLKASKRKKRKWEKQRRIIYNGSSLHFFRSVLNKNLEQEGFVVDKIKRIPNPDRPSDSIIREARRRLRDYYHLPSDKRFKVVTDKLSEVSISLDSEGKTKQEIEKYEQIRDSLSDIVSKARLKPLIDSLVQAKVAQSEFVVNFQDRNFLKFPNHLKIKYMNEPEEDNYRSGWNKLPYQVSMVTLLVNSAAIDNTGTLINPLDMFMEGYWSYEKIADTLPLDYETKD